MTVLINHAIVAANDKLVSARFFADLFGLAEPEEAGFFAVIRLDAAGNYLEAITRPYSD